MPLLPNRGKRLLHETNVDAPAGLKVSSAYDLDLYEELGNASRGVLVVTYIAAISFDDGKATAGGAKLTWSGQDKTDFISGFKSQVKSVWEDKHRIKTTSSVPAVQDVGVIFDLQVTEGLSRLSHSHWNISVIKVDSFRTSCVKTAFSTFISNGDADLDSLDTSATPKGASVPQHGVVHEFGHMLGYRDEYVGSDGKPQDNGNWTGDLESVMNVGETARPRHYTFLADWLTSQYKVAASLAKEPIDWKVNGSVDLVHALV
jgi:hypothetical protein